MSIAVPYFIITIIVGIMAITEWNTSPKTIKTHVADVTRYRVQNLSIIIILALFSAFRQITASSIDEYVYRRRFDSYAMQGLPDILSDTIEDGFAILVWISTRIFQTNQGIIIVTGTITTILFLFAFKRYSTNYSLAIVLFMVTGVFYNTFNGIQQFLAAAIFVVCFQCVYEKKWKLFFVIVFVCSLIHVSSVFLLLIYPLSNVKTGTVKMWMYQGLFLLLGSAIYRMLPTIIERYGILQEYETILLEGHHGVKWMTIAIALVPAFIAVLYGKLKDTDDFITDAFANVTILNGMIYLLASIDTYIARLALFTEPFSIIFLVRVMKYMKNASLIKYIMVVLYAVVLYLRMRDVLYTWNFSL